MKRVGHDDAKTTLKIYTHVTERMMQSSLDNLKIHFLLFNNTKKQKTIPLLKGRLLLTLSTWLPYWDSRSEY